MLASISTPEWVESRLGTLEFTDGAPSEATARLRYDHLDFVHGVQAFMAAFPGASLEAVRQRFLSIGVEDNAVLLFSELMDSASLLLTANCDTVYFLSFVDLADGPMVVDVPPLGAPSGILGTIDDRADAASDRSWVSPPPSARASRARGLQRREGGGWVMTAAAGCRLGAGIRSGVAQLVGVVKGILWVA
jgi:hypothetical protein